MVSILDDDDTVPFGTVEPEVVDKAIGSVQGRGIKRGRITPRVGSQEVMLEIDDEVNDEVWIHVRLTRDELASLLLQCAEEAR